MASNLLVMASNLLAMPSNLLAMPSSLLGNHREPRFLAKNLLCLLACLPACLLACSCSRLLALACLLLLLLACLLALFFVRRTFSCAFLCFLPRAFSLAALREGEGKRPRRNRLTRTAVHVIQKTRSSFVKFAVKVPQWKKWRSSVPKTALRSGVKRFREWEAIDRLT